MVLVQSPLWRFLLGILAVSMTCVAFTPKLRMVKHPGKILPPYYTLTTRPQCYVRSANGSTILLNMGLRDFIKNRVRRGGKNDTKNEDRSTAETVENQPAVSYKSTEATAMPTTADKAAKAAVATMSSANTTTANSPNDSSIDQNPVLFKKFEPRPMRMAEDPRTKEVNVHRLSASESIQERINRVKSGQMTEDEKEAFLQSALTAGNTPEQRKPIVNTSSTRKKVSASPFPSDSILRNFARGNKTETVATTVGSTRKSDRGLPDISTPKSIQDLEKHKQAYLEMVTDPQRFKGTNVVGDVASISREPTDTSNDASDTTSIPTKNDVLPLSATERRLPNDLGTRLANAALNQERQRQQDEIDRQELDAKEKTRLKQEVETRIREMTRQRDEEYRRQEAQRLQRQREQDQSKSAREQEAKRIERERQQELMKRQDEYWQKKLQAERASLEKLKSEEEARASDTRLGRFSKAASRVKRSINDFTSATPPLAESQVSKTENANSSEQEQQQEEEGKIRSVSVENNNNNDKTNSIATTTPSVPPKAKISPIETEKEFLATQRKQKSDLDQIRAEQMQKLRNLNSPLPTSTRKQPANTNEQKKSAMQENRQVKLPESTTPPSINKILSDKPAGRRRPSSGKEGQLSSAMQENRKVDIPVSSNNMPRAPSLASILSGVRGTSSTRASPPDADTSTKASDNDSSDSVAEGGNDTDEIPLSSLFTATQLKSNKTEEDVVEKLESDNDNNKKKVPSTPKQVVKKAGPIRMTIPDTDEDEDGVDVRSNKTMSVAEAMRRTVGDDDSSVDQDERSKKWGIDMSRFN